MNSYLTFFSILIVFMGMSIGVYSQCACNEYIYLNEPVNNGKIHKFSVNPDGTLTEIGNPWFDNPAIGESVSEAHGLGTDLNGFLYIGETNNGRIRRFDCDGGIVPDTEFAIEVSGLFNAGSIGNTLYTNDKDSGSQGGIHTYDLCTGDPLGYYCLNGDDSNHDWGLYVDAVNNKIYATEGYIASATTDIWVFDPSQETLTPEGTDPLGSTNCIEPWLSENANDDVPSRVMGIVSDTNGNIYVVGRGNSGQGTIYKYSSTGVLLAQSVIDDVEGDGGYYLPAGIVYIESIDRLYVSSESFTDDCITLFDTDLNYLGAVVPATGTGTDKSKGIAKIKECCPIPSTQTFDITYCVENPNEQIFLNEILGCDGIICAGTWEADGVLDGMVYEDCSQSVRINGDGGCSTFTKSSDGSSDNSICGAFVININVELLAKSSVTIAGDQTLCPNTPTELTSSTTSPNNLTYQWQMSTTSCTEGFADIAGANAANYTPMSISQDTYFRLLMSNMGDCSTGACVDTSNCVTLSLNTDCPTFNVSLDKTVAPTQAVIGEPIVFTIVVTNEEDAVTNATVIDMLPTGFVYDGSSYVASVGTFDGTTWSIGNMASGAVETIDITVTATEEGIYTNSATVTVDEPEDPTDNTDTACVSVPIEVCDNEVIDIDIIAEAGYTNYQWYKDGLLISGETSETYKATATGSYTYTVDGAGLGDCVGELCCPVVIESVSCCPAIQCLPVSVTRL